MALLWMWSASAQGAIPVAVYPVQGTVSARDLADAQRLTLEAVKGASSRGTIRPADPLLLGASCPPPVKPACVAGLGASDGATLFAVAKRTGDAVAVTLWLVRPDATFSRPTRFEFTEFQDLRGASQAILLLEEKLEVPPTVAVPPPTALATAPLPSGPGAEDAPTREATVVEAPASAPLVVRPQAPLSSTPPSVATSPATPQDPAAWQKTVGTGAAIGGGVLLAGGAVFGLLARGINDDLTRRFASRTLVPGDRASYDRLQLYSVLANTLMVSGGAGAAAGGVLWILATPSGGGAYYSRQF